MMNTGSSDADVNHVIVVGGGLAGLCATIEATRHGAKVTIIEKEKGLGGNSAKATSGINGVDTEAQDKHGVKDSVKNFIQDTISSGDGLSDPKLVRVLASQSGQAIDFLRTFNLNLMDVVQLGGHSAKRTHRFPPTADGKPVPVGFTIISTLKKYVTSEEITNQVTVLTNTVFKGIVKRGGKSVGVKYVGPDGSEKELEGVVVLTAGGYANDHTETSLLEKYVPDLAKYPTTNGPWATGDVIKAVENSGVDLIHMDKVQVHPTGFVDPKDPTFHTKFLAPEALRGCGAILLDGNGKRFVNELARRDHVTAEIMSRCSNFKNIPENPITATMLLSQEVIDKFSAPLAGFYVFKGLIQNVTTLSAVSNLINVPEETLKQTLREYSEAAASGRDAFGKSAFPMTFNENSNFYIAFVTPTLHYCMGGLHINEHAQILTDVSAGGTGEKDLQPIPGLYGAGEVTGGIHGNNRLGGNSLLECVVFGRIAGYQAAHYK